MPPNLIPLDGAPRRTPVKWRYILPASLLIALLLILHVPRQSHLNDELGIESPSKHATIGQDEPQRPFVVPLGHGEPLRGPNGEAASDVFPGLRLALTQVKPKRVAIVGAGASGSAAAFFLRRAARIMEDRIGVEEGTLLGDVVVVDREGYVGGRSTTVYPYGNTSLNPVELGASIFVDANKNLVKAARLFNLSTPAPDFASSGITIYNGTHFLYTTSLTHSLFSGWYDTISAIFRYGPLSPYRTNNAVSALLTKFALLYNPKFLSEQGAAGTVEEMVERVGLGRDMTMKRADDWAEVEVGVGARWMGEIMEGSTRSNYARDMSEIHALGAAVSMATSGAKSVKGGNWQIFAGMLKNASATVVLGTEVTDILPFISETGQQQFQLLTNTSLFAPSSSNHPSASDTHDDAGSLTDAPFDSIIFAAPWHLSPVAKSMDHYFTQAIPKQRYVHLHVTLFTTTKQRPDARFFGLDEGVALANTILTTAYDVRMAHPNGTVYRKRPSQRQRDVADDDEETVRHIDEEDPQAEESDPRGPRFQSISWHAETSPGSGEYVVKIFSLERISDETLHALVDEQPGWVLRKEWDSYPALGPVKDYAPVMPMKGFHYLAALEPWVSTMETQTLSAREAVARIVAEWWGMTYGECRGKEDAWDWTCPGI